MKKRALKGADKIDNTLANVSETRNSKQKANTIVNNEGLTGKDALYTLIGLSALLSAAGALFGKYFMRSGREKILEKDNEELLDKYQEKNLLKASINEVARKSNFNKEICEEIILTYDNYKLIFKKN